MISLAQARSHLFEAYSYISPALFHHSPFSISPPVSALSFYLLSILLSISLSSPYVSHNIISLLLPPLSISPLHHSLHNLFICLCLSFPLSLPPLLYLALYTYLTSIVRPPVPVLFLHLHFLPIVLYFSLPISSIYIPFSHTRWYSLPL